VSQLAGVPLLSALSVIIASNAAAENDMMSEASVAPPETLAELDELHVT